MRTIKFRGKRTDKDEWIYGYLSDGNCICDWDNKERRSFEVKAKTIGQYTGLVDKNGKEIYEGDIIHLIWDNYNKDFGVVRWHSNGYYYIDDTFGKYPKDKANPIGNFLDFINQDFKGIEPSVNGNIHDNPDLLKNND